MPVSTTIPSPIAGTRRSDDATTAKRMAKTITDLMKARGAEGTVSADDLHSRGFTPEQVSVYGPAAKARAARLFGGKRG